MQTRKWQDKSGQDRYTTEIKASSMQMLDSRRAGAEESSAKKLSDDGFDVFNADVPFFDAPANTGFSGNEDFEEPAF